MRHLRAAASFGALYAASTSLSHWLSAEPSTFATFWVASGIYLAFLLRSPYRLWPAIVVGGFVSNVLTESVLLIGRPFIVSVGFAASNMLEALTGALALQAWARLRPTVRPSLSDFGFVLRLGTIGCVVAAVPGAVVGASLVQAVYGGAFFPNWLTWWAADAVGTLVGAPLLLLDADEWRHLGRRARAMPVETVAATTLFVVVCLLVFWRPHGPWVWPFLVLPPLLWATLRFGSAGTALAIALLALLGVRGTVSGFGPFSQGSLSSEQAAVTLQAFLSICSLCFLTLAAVLTRSEVDRAALAHLNQRLESEVARRTRDQDDTVQRLRRALDERAYAMALLDAIFEGAPVGLGFWDRQLRFQRVNERLAAMNGVEPAAHIGKTPAELLPGIDDVATLMDNWRRMLDTGVPMTDVEVVGSTPAAPNERRHWRENFFPVELGGEVVGLGAVVEDVTEQRRAADALRDADRRKDEFLAMLAHELRNPLAPIRNATQILRSSGVDEPTRAAARDIIDRQVAHIVRIVDDLLDVSRLTQGKLVLHPTLLDLADVARKTAEDYRQVIENAGVTLRLAVADEPIWVEGDATRLAQVLGNLLHNAQKFTPSGGVVTLELTCDRVRRLATLRVRDTGAGIPAELLADLFRPFSQGTQELDRRAGGLGLGLALVRGFAELHGGSVDASSEGPGHGAEFRVHLPLCTPSAPNVPTSTPVRPALEANVLVIEDNHDAAETLRVLLEVAGHRVAVARTGVEGLQKAANTRPDVVLCDIGLPGGLNGYDVARTLRARPGFVACLIAVTGYAHDHDKKLAADAGFDLHLTKPVSPSELLDVIARVRHTHGDRLQRWEAWQLNRGARG